MNLDGIRGRTSGRGWQFSNIWNAICRFILIIFACVVIGYYASDLRAAQKEAKYSDSKWVYAVVVGCMAAITAFIFMIISIFVQYRACAILFPWEWILFILWVAVVGIFASMYMHENPEMDSGVHAMRIASIFDIVNMLLWFIAAVVDTCVFFMAPRRSLHTGRAVK
ncbi:hypothetical protein H2198_008460 [Neophaeococcomyces mojaviensis]|uniref:Uncharacterized protein n=1 Tax=Neophaeococcomyces mojaviensis TaxID=3383035 RepID=A0ACC2ZX72_9EURO|nr:hypothetical protein H2198_008460 [Knufia sp. JES_112]